MSASIRLRQTRLISDIAPTRTARAAEEASPVTAPDTSPYRPVIGIPADHDPGGEGPLAHPRWQLNATYVSAVYDAGGLPLILPVLPEPAEQLMSTLDGVVLSGGGDVDPSRYGRDRHAATDGVSQERDDLEFRVFAAARERGLPVLGICRGHQVINVAMGGTLVQDIPDERPSASQHRQHLAGLDLKRDDVSHPVDLAAGCRLAEIYGATSVMTNSYHHQAVDDIAPGVVVTGRAADGTIESFEAPDEPFLVAMQWHPETLYRKHPEHARPFAALIAAARAYREAQTPLGARSR